MSKDDIFLLRTDSILNKTPEKAAYDDPYI
jgi:hypothetical protein